MPPRRTKKGSGPKASTAASPTRGRPSRGASSKTSRALEDTVSATNSQKKIKRSGKAASKQVGEGTGEDAAPLTPNRTSQAATASANAPERQNISDQLSAVQGHSHFLSCSSTLADNTTVALAKAEAENEALRKELEGRNASDPVEGFKNISKPQGTAGADWSIQVAMELDGSPSQYEAYKAIQVRYDITTIGCLSTCSTSATFENSP